MKRTKLQWLQVAAMMSGALLLLAAGCSKNGGTSTSPTGGNNFRGRLVSSTTPLSARAAAADAPIKGAEIVVDGVPTGVFTDSDGEFELTLAPGNHMITLVGYPNARIEVNVTGVTAMTVELKLNPDGTLTADQDSDKDGDLDEADDDDHDGDIDGDDHDEDHDGDANHGGTQTKGHD